MDRYNKVYRTDGNSGGFQHVDKPALWKKEQKKKPWFVAFADFHGMNISTTANAKPPMWLNSEF